jgi:hypothetical protein
MFDNRLHSDRMGIAEVIHKVILKREIKIYVTTRKEKTDLTLYSKYMLKHWKNNK